MANITISAETGLILFLEQVADKKNISKSAVAVQGMRLYQRLYGGDAQEVVAVMELIQDQLGKMGWDMKFTMRQK